MNRIAEKLMDERERLLESSRTLVKDLQKVLDKLEAQEEKFEEEHYIGVPMQEDLEDSVSSVHAAVYKFNTRI